MDEKVKARLKEGDWNLFRKHYPYLSFSTLQELNTAWDVEWPNQRCGSPRLMIELAQNIPDLLLNTDDVKFLELGCHDGYVASEFIRVFSQISAWYGYDIVSRPIFSGYRWGKYQPQVLPNYFYNLSELPEHDIFLCSHTFEHMKGREMRKCLELVKRFNTPYLILEIPPDITEGKEPWHNYEGSHVLELDGKQIKEMIDEVGYRLIDEGVWANGWISIWRMK